MGQRRCTLLDHQLSTSGLFTWPAARGMVNPKNSSKQQCRRQLRPLPQRQRSLPGRSQL